MHTSNYDTETIGILIPFGDSLIYTAGNDLESMKKMYFNNDRALIDSIHDVNNFRKNSGYKFLYIDRHISGIVNLRDDSFWEKLGFKHDVHPALLYLDD